MHLNIPHKFTKVEALSRVKNAIEQGRSQIPKEVELHEMRWEGDTLHFDFTAQGQHITGTLAVEDAAYVVDAKLPLMLRFFEGRIESEISERIKQLT